MMMMMILMNRTTHHGSSTGTHRGGRTNRTTTTTSSGKFLVASASTRSFGSRRIRLVEGMTFVDGHGRRRVGVTHRVVVVMLMMMRRTRGSTVRMFLQSSHQLLRALCLAKGKPELNITHDVVNT